MTLEEQAADFMKWRRLRGWRRGARMRVDAGHTANGGVSVAVDTLMANPPRLRSALKDFAWIEVDK